MMRCVVLITVLAIHLSMVSCQCSSSPTARGALGGVTTDSKICSEIGLEILGQPRATAADAYVAVAFCQGVVRPNAAGLGGGFLATIFRGKKIMTLNAREKAPGAATQNMFNGTSSTLGGKAMGVPGEVDGLGEIHGRYGKLPWANLLTPAINLCENGFEVDAILAEHISMRAADCAANPATELCKMISSDNNILLVKGDIMFRPKLAATLRKLATYGHRAFYDGSSNNSLPADIASENQAAGGIITADDLASYHATWAKPLKANYTSSSGENFTFYGPPPPSSAGIVMALVKCITEYGMTLDDLKDPDKEILFYHRFVECSKFNFGLRALLGDNEFNSANQANLLGLLQSDSLTATLLSKINDQAILPYAAYNLFNSSLDVPSDHGTSHYIVWYKNQVISATHTINLTFGNKVVGGITGIIQNNQMDDFSTSTGANFFGFQSSPSNFIIPGKRPMSSTTPTIVTNNEGKPILATGGSGGSRIISSLARVIVGVAMGQDAAQSTDLLRLHHQLSPNHIVYESGFQNTYPNVLATLASRGNPLSMWTTEFSTCQTIQNTCKPTTGSPGDDLCLLVVSDKRRCGLPVAL